MIEAAAARNAPADSIPVAGPPSRAVRGPNGRGSGRRRAGGGENERGRISLGYREFSKAKEWHGSITWTNSGRLEKSLEVRIEEERESLRERKEALEQLEVARSRLRVAKDEMKEKECRLNETERDLAELRRQESWWIRFFLETGQLGDGFDRRAGPGRVASRDGGGALAGGDQDERSRCVTFPDEQAQFDAVARVATILVAARNDRQTGAEITVVKRWAEQQVAWAALLETVLDGDVVVDVVDGVPVFRAPTAAERERIGLVLRDDWEPKGV